MGLHSFLTHAWTGRPKVLEAYEMHPFHCKAVCVNVLGLVKEKTTHCKDYDHKLDQGLRAVPPPTAPKEGPSCLLQVLGTPAGPGLVATSPQSLPLWSRGCLSVLCPSS